MSTNMENVVLTLIQAVQATQGINPDTDSAVINKCQECGLYSCRRMGCYFDVDETGE